VAVTPVAVTPVAVTPVAVTTTAVTTCTARAAGPRTSWRNDRAQQKGEGNSYCESLVHGFTP
jgi:hypothetical protein